MRIEKDAQAKRLLRILDVLIDALLYALTVNLFLHLGEVSGAAAKVHMLFLPFAFIFGLMASAIGGASFLGAHFSAVIGLALRHTLFVVTPIYLYALISGFELSTELLAWFSVILFTGHTALRSFLRYWYSRGRREDPNNYKQVLVIGTGPRAERLIDNYKRDSEFGVRIVGMLDPQKVSGVNRISGVPVLGSNDQIVEELNARVIDEVVICVPRTMLDEVHEIVDACMEQAVTVRFLADLYDFDFEVMSLDRIGNQPVLSFEPHARNRSQLLVKRMVDLILVIPVIVGSLPLFAVIALLIKMDSKGPVFFAQSRYGMNKRIFPMFKFRSMVEDAEALLKDIEHLNEAQGPAFKIEDDPRVTRVGRVLRRWSLDELPQFYNVLLGHMSLVGPRPMSMRDVDQFDKSIQRRRFSVRPGLACLREVSGRSRLSFDRWLELDLKYIREWSVWMDLKILGKLVVVVLSRDGAM